MTRCHLVIPDQHATPDHDNKRADWLGRLIADVQPDVLVNIGDACDFPSLCSYDKGKPSFHNKRYTNDINSHLDFQERMFHPLRKRKRKMPVSYFFEGNHEHRLSRAIEIHPELEGAIDFDHLRLEKYYNMVVRYNGSMPGVASIDGVTYAHFFVSGVMGRPIGGEHHAHSLLQKHYNSCTCGHSHLVDYSVRTTSHGKKISGLVAGCYVDQPHAYAGVCNSMWSAGVVIKRNVHQGQYDPQFISLESLRKEYG